MSTQSPQVVRFCCGDGCVGGHSYGVSTCRGLHVCGFIRTLNGVCWTLCYTLCVCLPSNQADSTQAVIFTQMYELGIQAEHTEHWVHNPCFYGIRSVYSITKYVICIKYIRLKARLVSFGVYVCMCVALHTVHLRYIPLIHEVHTYMYNMYIHIHSDLMFFWEKSDSTHPGFLLIIFEFFDVLRGHYFAIMVKYYLCKDVVYWKCWYKRQFWNHIKIFDSDWVYLLWSSNNELFSQGEDYQLDILELSNDGCA